MSDDADKLERMETVFSLAKEWTQDQREHDVLDEVFPEWWEPGHELEITPIIF
ncbi:hypothetical protein ACAW63_24265 [Pseudomonas sp. QE6]|uniref:hypothetical protein n=1 Tax=Pseudomonas sp. QE6 TaxID=3242491 RepID=UPI0035281F9F